MSHSVHDGPPVGRFILRRKMGDKLVKRFLKIDKLSTATGTENARDRPYRFGYGFLDEDLNGEIGEREQRVYFEFSDYSTSYVFFESPRRIGRQ